MVLLGKVVLVEQSAAVACNAHKKSAASCFLYFALCQWCIASKAFQLGSLPGISNRKTSVEPLS